MGDSTTTAFIFPGQGSQFVGMGRDLYDNYSSARAVFHLADETLGFALSHLCFEGPEAELRQTINAQPAILTVSLACLQAVNEVNPKILPVPAFVAGHSLGEYTALAVAGVFDFRTAMYLARERGRLMYDAGQKVPGSMAAVLGLEESILDEICRETGAQIANYNSPGQLVISGTIENVANASALAKTKGAARVLPLPVSGAFHSVLMQPAVDGMTKIFTATTFKTANITVIANTTAQPITSGEQVKAELITQLCNGIQWQRSVEYMVNSGVTNFIEIGPGKVLTGLVKRIAKNAGTVSIGDAESIKGLAKL